jgi:hypothetical protein
MLCIRHGVTLAALTSALLGTGCFQVDSTQVRVKDVRAIGVVADKDNRWLLPPGSPPETREIYRNFGMTANLLRSASGGIRYTSEHWALGTRIDTTPLVDDAGGASWVSTPRASARLTAAIEGGGEVRLHPVTFVRATGPFGMCNGTLFDSCVANPAVSMSLATDGGNIQEIDVLRTPIRGLGIGELILGTLLVGTAGAAAAVALPSHEEDARNVAVGVGAGILVLGGALIANGLWRLVTPEQRLVYRAPN